MKRIASKHRKTPAQVLLKYTVQRNIAVIPKSLNAHRIRDNINIFDFELDNQDVKDLRNLEIGPPTKVGNWESWTWYLLFVILKLIYHISSFSNISGFKTLKRHV